MSNTLQRLKIFIDYKQLTISSFEKSVGFSNGSFSSQLKRNKTIGVDKLENILKQYPDLSSEWVLTGKGEMINFGYKEETTTLTFPAIKKDEIAFGVRQMFLIEGFENKLISFIKNDTNYAALYDNILQFESFRHFADLFSEAYVNKLLTPLYDTKKYLIGNKFNYEEYKNEILKQLDQLQIVDKVLKEFIKAVTVFYSEFKEIDKENLLSEINHEA